MWIKDISTYVCMSDSQIILSDNPFPVGRSRPSKNAPSIIEIDILFDPSILFNLYKEHKKVYRLKNYALIVDSIISYILKSEK